MSRPSFVASLLSRELPPLTPHALGEAKNPPYNETIRSQIADQMIHPLLESVLHLMNDSLYEAHFLLRKMQEDDMGKWLHACLHLAEGDLEKNAKLWYQQTSPELLAKFWKGKDPAQAAIDAMYRIQTVHNNEPKIDQEFERQCRQTKWDELVAIFEMLEKEHGWKQVEGSQIYTKDNDPSHKSNVLGEGWRSF